MSERESEFMKSLKIWLGSFMLAVIIALGGFYTVTIKAQSAQEVTNKNTELRMSSSEAKIETKVSREELNYIVPSLVRIENKLDAHIDKGHK